MGDDISVRTSLMRPLLLIERIMDEIKKALSYTFAHSGEDKSLNMSAKSLASLMVQTNALVSIEVAVNLCSLSISEINYRIRNGRFPAPLNLSLDNSDPIYAFRIRDIQRWLNSPSEYYRTSKDGSTRAPKPGKEL